MTDKIVFADYNDYRRQYKAASNKGDTALRERIKAAWESQEAEEAAMIVVTPELAKANSKLELIKQYRALVITAKELQVIMLWEEVKYDSEYLRELAAHEKRGSELNTSADPIEQLTAEATISFYEAAIKFAEDWQAAS